MIYVLYMRQRKTRNLKIEQMVAMSKNHSTNYNPVKSYTYVSFVLFTHAYILFKVNMDTVHSTTEVLIRIFRSTVI
jgi:hypothetical protein